MEAINDADAVAGAEEVAEVMRTMDDARLMSVEVSDEDEEDQGVWSHRRPWACATVLPPEIAARP